MARKVRHSALESRSARLKLQVRRKPYPGPSLARGMSLMYRRNKTNGSWVLKASDGHGAYWTKRIADADDYADSDSKNVLTFFQAQDAAKRGFAKAWRGAPRNPSSGPPRSNRCFVASNSRHSKELRRKRDDVRSSR
jgi:hypothetical protein